MVNGIKNNKIEVCLQYLPPSISEFYDSSNRAVALKLMQTSQFNKVLVFYVFFAN